METKIVNHWGKWVNSEEPTTGVISSNNVVWEWITNEECLDCASAMEEEERENPDNPDYDHIECNSSHTKLLGDAWRLDTKTGKWDVIKDNPELEFAAIENETTVQVLWSKVTKRGALCSPCYPGQVDLDSEGDFLGYTLPDYLLNVD